MLKCEGCKKPRVEIIKESGKKVPQPQRGSKGGWKSNSNDWNSTSSDPTQELPTGQDHDTWIFKRALQLCKNDNLSHTEALVMAKAENEEYKAKQVEDITPRILTQEELRNLLGRKKDLEGQ